MSLFSSKKITELPAGSSMTGTEIVAAVQNGVTRQFPISQILALAGGGSGGSGWSPLFAIASDGARRVLQITDWTGGTGTKPAVGYVGASAIVSTIGAGVDIRGAVGTAGADGHTPVPLSGTGAPSSGTGLNGDIYLNGTNGDLYGKNAGAWVLLGNLKGPAGEDGQDGGASASEITASYVLASDFCNPNGKQVLDGTTTSGSAVVTSPTAAFAVGDVGKVIEIVYTGTNAATLVTTITAVNSASSVTVLSAPATSSAGVARITFGSDCTDGINAALAYCFANNIRKLWCKKGIYMLNRPIQEYVSGILVRSQIVIPWDTYGDANARNRASITIDGEFAPTGSPGNYAAFGAYFDNELPSTNGTIFYSTLQYPVTSDINAYPAAVIATGGVDILGSTVNISVIFTSNIIVRVQWDNVHKTPHMTGINMMKANTFLGENLTVDTNGLAISATSVTNDYIHAGIILPQINDNLAQGLKNAIVHGGFLVGIFVGEHSKIPDAHVTACYHGFVFGKNGHPASLGHVTTHSCARQVTANPGYFGIAPGTAYFRINLLVVERIAGIAPTVFNFEYGIDDSNNYLRGDVGYTLSNSGANTDGSAGHDNTDFTVNGGANVGLISIGDDTPGGGGSSNGILPSPTRLGGGTVPTGQGLGLQGEAILNLGSTNASTSGYTDAAAMYMTTNQAEIAGGLLARLLAINTAISTGDKRVASLAAITNGAINNGKWDFAISILGTLTSMFSVVASGIGVNGNIFIGNTSAPGTPTAGGVLYVEGGALKYKGSGGTVTTLGAP